MFCRKVVFQKNATHIHIMVRIIIIYTCIIKFPCSQLMELEFQRADLLQLDPISCRGTLKLLPPGKKKKVFHYICLCSFSLTHDTSKNLSSEMIQGLYAATNSKKENQWYIQSILIDIGYSYQYRLCLAPISLTVLCPE